MAAMTKERLDEIERLGNERHLTLAEWVELLSAARESIRYREALERISEYGCIEAEPYDGPCAASICRIARTALEAK